MRQRPTDDAAAAAETHAADALLILLNYPTAGNHCHCFATPSAL